MSGSISVQRWLSEAELDQELKTADSGECVRRLGFLKNLYMGDSISEAIAREGLSESTGYRWVHRWNDGGLEGLLPDSGGGRPPKLSDSEEEAFLECVVRRQPVSMDTVESMLQSEFGVEYAAEYLPQKLEEIGLTYRPPARAAVDRGEVCDAIEWDQKTPIEGTGWHPYNEQSSRREAGWLVSE